MPVKSAARPGASAPEEMIEQRFRRLEAAWLKATGHLSSTTKICDHPTFQEIVQLGPDVVPFMLQDLVAKPRLWVWALPIITKANPVPQEHQGNIAKMTEAWLTWSRDKGLLA